MRIPYLTPETLSDEQRALYDAIRGGKRGQGSAIGLLANEEGGLIGPFNAWLLSPNVGQRVQSLGEALRFGNSLENHVLEIAILVTAEEWRAEFEWWAHARLAGRAEVAPEVIEAIRTGQTPEFVDPKQQVVYEISRTLHKERRIDDALYRRGIELLGEQGVVDLIALLGYYTLVSMTLNVFEVPLPAGEPDPFT